MTAPLRLLAGTAASLLVACSSTPPPPKPTSPLGNTCLLDTTLATRLPEADRAFPPPYWFALLVQGVRSTGALAQPALDCTSSPIRSTGGVCPAERPRGPAAADTPFDALTPDNLFVKSLGGALRLAWVTTGRFANGEMIGPVALVELAAGAMIVKKAGVLRAFASRPTLRLEKVGKNDVLVVEGDACEGGGETCDRGLRLMPVRRDRFVDVPIEDGQQTCLGPSFIALRARGHAQGPAGGSYQFESAVTFGGAEIAVREQLSVEPNAKKSAGLEGFVSRVQGDRTISLRDGRLVASGPSLLERWLSKTR